MKASATILSRRLWFWAMAVCLACSAAHAADDAKWLRRKVIIKPGAVPRVGRKNFRWTDIPIPATVTKTDGDWLWAETAWVKSNDVLLPEDAPAYFTKQLRAQPGMAVIWYQLRGVAWILRHDYVNAMRDASEAIRMLPGDAQLYVFRSMAYNNLAEYDKALADCDEAIRLDPSLAVAYNNRGAVYKDMGNYAKAHDAFSEAIRLDTKGALYYQNRGVNWYKRERYDEAIADLDQAVKLDPKMISAWCNRGYAKFKKGDFDQALADFHRAVELDPEDPLPHHELARFYAICPFEDYRDGTKAVEEGTQACELDRWETWDYVAGLAAAYAELGNFEKAVQYQQQAIDLDRRPESQDLSEMAKRMEYYQAGKPWREQPVSQE